MNTLQRFLDILYCKDFTQVQLQVLLHTDIKHC